VTAESGSGQKPSSRTDPIGSTSFGRGRRARDGVAQVDDQMRVKNHVELAAEELNEQKAQSKFYTVEFYDVPMKYSDIFEANQLMLQDPDLIYPGQVLRIPPVGGAAEASADTATPKGIQ